MWSFAVIIIIFLCCLVSTEAEVPRHAIRRIGNGMHGRQRRVLGWNYPVRNQQGFKARDFVVTSSLSGKDVVLKKPSQERPGLNPVAAPRTRTYSKHALPGHNEYFPFHAKASPRLAQKMEVNKDELHKNPNNLILKHMQKVIERLDVIKATANPRIQHLYSLLKEELHRQQPHSYLPDEEAKKHTFVNRLEMVRPDGDKEKRTLYRFA